MSEAPMSDKRTRPKAVKKFVAVGSVMEAIRFDGENEAACARIYYGHKRRRTTPPCVVGDWFVPGAWYSPAEFSALFVAIRPLRPKEVR